MLKRLLQLLTLAALVNLIYQYWPRGEADVLIPVASTENKWGFIDSGGRVRIELEWDSVGSFEGPFSGNYAAIVHKDGAVGLINKRGELITPVIWGEIWPFNKLGQVVMWNREEPSMAGVMDATGKIVHQPEWDIIDSSKSAGYHDHEIRAGSKEGEYDAVAGYDLKENGFLLPDGTSFSSSDWWDFSAFGPQGITTVGYKNEWFLINKKGEVIKDEPLKYLWIDSFGANGLARVTWRPDYSVFEIPEEAKWGWIDLTGNLKIPAVWDYSRDFDENGLAAVKRDGKWGLIDESGNVVIEPTWEWVDSFDDHGYARVFDGENGWFIDREGNAIIEPVWSFVSLFDKAGHSIVKTEDGLSGTINREGEIVIEPKWITHETFNEYDLLRVRTGEGEDEQMGFVDRTGKLLFLSDYHVASMDSNGRAKFADRIYETESLAPPDYVYKGWLDKHGEVVIEIPEGWQGDTSDGYYQIQKTREVSGMRAVYHRVKGWMTDKDPPKQEFLYRVMDKDGHLIWANTMLRKTTKAWLFLIVTLMPLLILFWWKRRHRKASE